MAKPGRNDPCPCGSGKKYKRCCLRGEEPASLLWGQMRRGWDRFTPELSELAMERWGGDLLDAAWRDFCIDDQPVPPDSHPDAELLFVPWFVYCWTPDPHDPAYSGEWPAGGIAHWYLGEHADELDAPSLRFLEAATGGPCRFLAVEEIDEGRSVGVEDVLSRERFRVFDRELSKSVDRGCMFFGFLATIDDVSLLVGAGSALIAPAYRGRLVALREHLAIANESIDAMVLADYDYELRRAYHDLAEQTRSSELPELRNTDGHELVWTKLRFSLACDPKLAHEKLSVLDVTEDADREPVVQPADDASTYTVDWNRREGPVAGSEYTALGTLTASPGELRAEVNSKERADALRLLVEELLGDDVRFLAASHESMHQALAAAAEREPTSSERQTDDEQRAFEQLPEVQAKLREMAARHWEAWLDETIPALDHQTPREAARSERGRELLESLLDDYARHNRHGDPGAFRADVGKLRRDLGLDPE